MQTDILSKHLSWAAVGINFLAFALYVPYASPNTSAWSLWAFVTVMSAITYTKMTGDPVKNVLAQTNTVLTVLAFAYFVIVGTFQKVGYWDMIAFVVGLFACFVWWWYRSATYAQLIIQVCIAIGFIPNLMSVWVNPATEPPYAWLAWTLTSIVQCFVVSLRWKKWQDIVAPINGGICTLAVGLLALRA